MPAYEEEFIFEPNVAQDDQAKARAIDRLRDADWYCLIVPAPEGSAGPCWMSYTGEVANLELIIRCVWQSYLRAALLVLEEGEEQAA